MEAAAWAAPIATGHLRTPSIQRQHTSPVREADHFRGLSGHFHRMTSSLSVLPYPPRWMSTGSLTGKAMEASWKVSGDRVEGAAYRMMAMHVALANRIADDWSSISVASACRSRHAPSNGGEYVYPEDDLRREFWQFIRWRAADTRMQYDDPPEAHKLNELEDDRDGYLISMYDTQGPEEFRHGGCLDSPVAYMRLQDALLAFLIYRVSSSKGFRYSYETWLRTVVLIVTQAQREPGFLTVHVKVNHEETLLPATVDRRHGQDREFTMTLDGSWDCLSREAFETIQKTLS